MMAYGRLGSNNKGKPMILAISAFEIARDIVVAALFVVGGVAVLYAWGYFHRPKK